MTEKTIRTVNKIREINRVAELAASVGISKSTAHDHLSTLQKYDLVVRENGEYHVGLGFFSIGEHPRRRHEIYEIARPEIDKLAAQTGELANLLVADHWIGVYPYRSCGENAMTLVTYTEKGRYLHRTALGKGLLSQVPRAEVPDIIDPHGMPSSTEHTNTDWDELLQELKRINEEEIAGCNQEPVEGLQCVAAPVSSNAGRVLGAISVAVPITRMQNEEPQETIPEFVLQAANVTEIKVTYS